MLDRPARPDEVHEGQRPSRYGHGRPPPDSYIDLERAVEYDRLLQDYELMFWNTLADGVS
jgi:hypothetical protein